MSHPLLTHSTSIFHFIFIIIITFSIHILRHCSLSLSHSPSLSLFLFLSSSVYLPTGRPTFPLLSSSLFFLPPRDEHERNNYTSLSWSDFTFPSIFLLSRCVQVTWRLITMFGAAPVHSSLTCTLITAYYCLLTSSLHARALCLSYSQLLVCLFNAAWFCSACSGL